MAVLDGSALGAEAISQVVLRSGLIISHRAGTELKVSIIGREVVSGTITD